MNGFNKDCGRIQWHHMFDYDVMECDCETTLLTPFLILRNPHELFDYLYRHILYIDCSLFAASRWLFKSG